MSMERLETHTKYSFMLLAACYVQVSLLRVISATDVKTKQQQTNKSTNQPIGSHQITSLEHDISASKTPTLSCPQSQKWDGNCDTHTSVQIQFITKLKNLFSDYSIISKFCS